MRGLEILLQSAPAQPAVYRVVVYLVTGQGAAGLISLVDQCGRAVDEMVGVA